MDLQDALISANVQSMRVDHDTHNAIGMDGFSRQIAGQRHIKLEIELLPRNNEELNWLTQSLAKNGMRISLIPAGSPIIHPAALMEKAMSEPVKTDKPHCMDAFW